MLIALLFYQKIIPRHPKVKNKLYGKVVWQKYYFPLFRVEYFSMPWTKMGVL